MSLYTAQEIMDIIPHRYPFLLIDTIEELEPGTRALGRKCVSVNEPFFQGHFPGNPVMPGVLIIEALAQVGRWPCCPSRIFRDVPLILRESTRPDFAGRWFRGMCCCWKPKSLR